MNEYKSAQEAKNNAKQAQKEAECAKEENERLKKENEALRAKLHEKYNELLSYVQTVQQSAKDKQKELTESLDFIKYGDRTEWDEVEEEARKLRSETTVIYKGQTYNVEAIVQGSRKEAERIIKAKREAKKNAVRERVDKFISDTEEMLEGYDIDDLTGPTR